MASLRRHRRLAALLVLAEVFLAHGIRQEVAEVAAFPVHRVGVPSLLMRVGGIQKAPFPQPGQAPLGRQTSHLRYTTDRLEEDQLQNRLATLSPTAKPRPPKAEEATPGVRPGHGPEGVDVPGRAEGRLHDDDDDALSAEANRGPSTWPREWRESLAHIAELAPGRDDSTMVYRGVLARPTKGFQVGVPVVVKEVILRTKAHAEQVRREIAVMKRFSGGEFVSLLKDDQPEVRDSGARVLLMMERGSGTLRDFAIAGDLEEIPWRTKAKLLYQMFRGAATLSQQGFVHRDLKPSNLVIFGDCFSSEPLDCCLKIGDFGISIGLAGTGHEFEKTTEELGWRSGTRLYMPPEALAGSPVESTKQDSYAAGVIIAEVLFGVDPRSFYGSARSAKEVAEECASRIEDDMGQAFCRIVEGLLKPVPLNRTSVPKALAELQPLAEKYGW